MSGVDLTHGHLLGGRISYSQPRTGYRTGIEPVFLAAAVPARPGERVLEGGTGAGAGLLCLAARISGVTGLGLEIEPAMAAIAARNFAENDTNNGTDNEFRRLTVRTADLRDLASLRDLSAGFDHAMANPPWHAVEGTPSPEPLRQRAKVAPAGLIAAWIVALGRCLRLRGSLTLILPPRALPEAVAVLPEAGLGSPLLFPLWPRAGEAARLMLLQAQRGGRSDCRILPGLILHEGAGYTPAATAVLRAGAALDLSAARWSNSMSL
jgi:tRNA1(Val) A37 N6-methylase TrmN6